MITQKEIIDVLKKFKNQNSEDLGIVNIGLFGSFARNENTANSDIDILYELDEITWNKICKVEESLSKLFTVNTDVVCKHKALRPFFLKRIEQEIIYV
ncbi:MAG: nucleotidyltransferase domain-containing protein [Firmicutes bacterium]|nr:nucleotidyltransferase domain-containing protein [Bacillota bacterium]